MIRFVKFNTRSKEIFINLNHVAMFEEISPPLVGSRLQSKIWIVGEPDDSIMITEPIDEVKRIVLSATLDQEV